MLEKIREGSQGVWAMLILGLVILSFAFAGVGGYIGSSSDPAAAEVNGEEISQLALDRAYQSERSRLEQQFGDAFAALAADAEYLNNFRQGILDRLIGDKLIEQAARELGLRISEQQINTTIRGMREFQGISGEFDRDRFTMVIRQANFQVASFKEYMRKELTRQQVSRALFGSEFALPSETQQAHVLQAQTRDVKYLTIAAAPFAESIEISAEDIESYYQANSGDYDTNEQVSVEYVELKVEDILPTITVSEEELNESYQLTMESYRAAEERRASHILIEFGDDKDAAKATAEALLAQVKSGEDFAELAKNSSADTFSAENGGDLDWFDRTMMDPAFSDAAFALTDIGDVTEVVESEFGFHIIKLTDLKAEQISPFEEVREEILAAVKAEKAAEEFYALQTRMDELAFEVPESLDEVAAELNVSIQKTPMFEQSTAPAPINGPLPLAAAFNQELIADRVNSEVLKVDDSHVVVLRVAEYEPARTKSLEEMTDFITTRLKAEKSQQAAKQWAEELLALIKSGESVTEKLAEKTIEWQEQLELPRFGSSIDRLLAAEAFKLSMDDDNNKAVVELSSGDVGLVSLLKINQPEAADAQQKESIENRLVSGFGQTSYTSLIESLKADADIVKYN
jgi:peptidyl-prolyl cis-trans isomerase D